VSLSFYGMSTFEGPMMSIKTVNALATTPTGPSATCTRRLGWVGLITMGSLYYLIPRLFGRKQMYSVKPSSCTSGSPPSASCCTSPRCGSPA
jgi:cytochrome c oxidase cbb3-type subunit 1